MKINGRLGNHLFQIATAYALSKQTNQDFVIVYYEHLSIDYISYFPELKFVTNATGHTQRYSEASPGVSCFVFNEGLKNMCANGDILLDGWFQTEKYFKEYLPDLKNMFLKRPVKEIDGYFIHVRRTDYVNNARFDLCNIEYYKLSLEHFPKDATFYIVSDDINYCKSLEVFQNLENKEFPVLDALDTLHFMAGCRGGICANSSFSWWGSYLGKREIVTMPHKWINGMEYRDVHPENVILIDF
jgi:hypothetical protein